MRFADELARILPPDLPHRDRLIQKGARHLELIHGANEQFNLTRITDAREAAIKHVWDSVAPWKLFSEASKVLDAGTGAGFPGIPLAIVLPDVRFTLTESIQKKARFVEAAVDALELENVTVLPERAEQIAQSAHPDIITARAVAPLDKITALFASSLRNGTRLVLYKGPGVESEMSDTLSKRFHLEVLTSYELPEQMGSRTLVELRSSERRNRKPNPARQERQTT